MRRPAPPAPPRSAWLLPALVAVAAGTAHADPPNNPELVCRADRPAMDKYAYLRALSLDLRGTIPKPEEVAGLDGKDDVPPELIDAWLGSDEFVGQAVRRHRALLWNNVANLDLVNYQAFLSVDNPSYLYWRGQPARLYRGGGVPCDDTPARFVNGQIQYRIDEKGYKREGYVMVSPYFAPATPIKLCAFDAQTTLISSKGTDCSTNAAFSDAECGCGPDARFCLAYDQQARIQKAIRTDVEQRISDVIRGDLPYTELFTGRTAYVNGPFVHYLKYHTGMPSSVSLRPLPYPIDQLPDLKFSDETLVPVQLGPSHAGVLTSPAYLLRFQTNRARANRYFDSFLCQPFQPPVGGLPSPDNACSQEPDLQARCGCKYCHSLLEPAAAHWGRWSPSGAAFLDPVAYPKTRADCVACATTGRPCSQDCLDRYFTHALTDKEKPYLGTLMAYYFRRPEHEQNVEQGPRYLALSSVVDNRLPSCTSRRAAEWLLGRDLTDDELAWTQTMARQFVSGGYSYRALVKAIVTSDHYRRVR